MKKLYILASAFLLCTLTSMPVTAQICDSLTPVFNVNLSGQPNGTWISPSIQRDGSCCGVTAPDKCIEFIVILDSLANGINFNIASGAIPSGAMFYQVNCGPPTQVGQPVCLNGPGPHLITFCKPGNNTNSYQITSFPMPSLDGTQYVSNACSGQLNTTGLIDTSITWNSIPSNPTYNSYLSCPTGCDTVTIIPNGTSLPAFVDYQVCGYVIGGCNPFYFCDTMRVYFVNDLTVNITPQNPVICFGGPNATVTANTTGGLSPYSYLWSNGATSQSITVGAGTYTVQLQDSLSCSIAYDTVIVTALASTITANAGSDQLQCTNQQSVALNGSVNVATGGQWFGGNGIFSPSGSALNAIYTPSVSEINAGTVQLFLVTTGNSSCPADTDDVVITISPSPVPSIIGNTNVCEFSTQMYNAPFVAGINYNWTVNGGSISSLNNNNITVAWSNATTGTLTLTETNAAGCDSTIIINITINPKPTPSITGPPMVCTSAINQFTIANPVIGHTYNWTVTGGTIVGSTTTSSINVQWNNNGNATVAVTEANSFGCDSTVSIPVNVLTMPVPVMSGRTNVCELQTTIYSTPFISGNTYTWNVSGGNIIYNNISSITVQWPTAGSGTVSLTEANTSTCDSTVSINVIIGPQPIPVIAGSAVVCTSTTGQYNVANPIAGNTYNWTVTGGTIVGSTTTSSINVQWNNNGNATVAVTEANSFGCDSTVSIPVNVLTMPVPVMSGPTNVCEMQTAVYSTPFISGITCTWNVSGGNIIYNNINSITVQWSTAGSGTVSLTEANTSTCDSTVSINVIIGPQPIPVIAGSAVVCTSTTGQYNVANPIAGNTYNWTVTGGIIVGSTTTSSINVQWNNNGNATVAVTEANSFGCDSTVSIPVNVLTMPVPVMSGRTNVCELQTTIYSTPLVSGNSYTWNVIGGNVISNNISSITVQWPTAGSGTVSLTEANTSTCDSTVSINVIIGPQPIPVITGFSSVCTLTSAQYTIANPVAANVYSWTVSGGTIMGAANADNISVLWDSAGIGIVTVSESNSFGCDSAVSFFVSVKLKPTPVLSGAPVACEYDTATYSVQNVIGHTYFWSVTGGTVVGLNVGNSIEVLWTTPGIGEVTLREISPEGCDSIVSASVNINPVPSSVLPAPLSICEKEVTTINLQPTGGNSYNWSVSGGGNINGSVSTTSLNIYWITPGNWNIQLTETTQMGCSKQALIPVQVFQKPYPHIAGSNLGCISNSLSTYNAPSVTGISYQWLVAGGNIVSGNGSSTIRIQWTTPGSNSISLTSTNTTTGCDSTVTILVETDSLATPVIQAGSHSGCTPVNISFSGNNLNPNYQYQWSFGDGTMATTVDPLHQFTFPGIYDVTLLATNNTGCHTEVSSQVTVYPVPESDFTLSYQGNVYYAGESILTLNNLSAGASQYHWDFSNGDTSGLFEPAHQFTSPGNYPITLTATNQWGCVSIATRNIEVKVPEDIYVPNAFTPNGDGLNDYFSIAYNNVSFASITIYDRWGERIYTSSDRDFHWDGTYHNKIAQQGVYVYKIYAIGYHDKKFYLNGTVTILR